MGAQVEDHIDEFSSIEPDNRQNGSQLNKYDESVLLPARKIKEVLAQDQMPGGGDRYKLRHTLNDPQ